MKLLPSFIIVSTLSLIFFMSEGCYYDIEEELYPGTLCDTSSAVSYSLDIVPILQSNCYRCHNSVDFIASINITTYAKANELATNGSLVCVVDHRSGCSPMPPSGAKISPCEVTTIERWIAGGALDN